MSENKDYPIGIQSFEKLRNEQFLYVDKTEFVYRLTRKSGYYFLSRPRRFGKSLLLSTFEAYFLGKRELFKGLAIDRHEDVGWEEYPVLHLDLNAQDYTKEDDSLYNQLDKYLKKWEGSYGIIPEVNDLGIRFSNVIESAYAKTGRQVVVLIDEYDKPLLQNLSEDRKERQDRFRNTLKGFYGVLKSCDPYIKFCFITGVTKFSHVSVFSDLNNLRDLTLEPDFNAICGITESELQAYFKDGIELLAERQRMSFEEACTRLRQNYDGYRFSEEETEGIYNPFSILNAMVSRRCSDYWFQTGTPTMLVELLRARNVVLTELEGVKRTPNALMGLDPDLIDPIPLLFQSGYLTIKRFIRKGRLQYFELGFPNEEVQDGFVEALFPFYVNRKKDTESASIVTECVESLEERRVGRFMDILKSLLAGVPYGERKEDNIHENRFRDVMYIICRLMGMSVQCELHTVEGRIDMTVETDRYIYVMEFKIDKSPADALAQIEEKHYADRYLSDPREVVKVGVNFSNELRNISGWETDPKDFALE